VADGIQCDDAVVLSMRLAFISAFRLTKAG
jgi:hypothetical protein